jgi:hypothetical protein
MKSAGMAAGSGRRSGGLLLALASTALSAGIVLDVPQVFQEQTEWCWAGTSTAVLRYYGKTVQQCDVVNYTRQTATWHDFGKDDCCLKPSGACNYWNYNYGYPGSISEILGKWGVPNRSVGKPLTLQEAARELDAKRPFILRWAYRTSGGHFVVGYGLADSMLHYMDPWKGEGAKMAKYAWVVSNKDKNWGETNLMTSAPTGIHGALPKERTTDLQIRTHPGSLVATFTLARASSVELVLTSLDGRLVERRSLPDQAAGTHVTTFGVAHLPPGGCVLQMRTDDTVRGTRAIVLP